MAECSGVGDKKRRRNNLIREEKVLILNVYEGLRAMDKQLGVSDAVIKCSYLTKVSESTIYNILKKSRDGSLTRERGENCKPESRGRKKIVLDDQTRNAIRREIHSFYFRNEIPSVAKLSKVIEADDTLPNISDKVLRRTLKLMNFRYQTRSRNSALIERNDIVEWRRNYLKQIRQFRNEGRHIYYLDETWLNEGHTVSKVWQDMNIRSNRQAFMEGFSSGLKAPSGKGRRLIIAHIGSEEGFVEGGLLSFQSKKTVDYHEEMDGNRFETWFRSILTKVTPGSVIVMDNASYHSRRLEQIPTSASRKRVIIDWLESKSIPHNEAMLKVELLSLVRKHKSSYIKYVVDEMAKDFNVSVVRLPPYHCELNPIELVWAQVKNYVARKNSTFKMADVEKLFDEALHTVTAESWRKCIQHVLKEEIKFWDLDIRVEVMTEPLIIDIGGESDDSEESSGSDTASS